MSSYTWSCTGSNISLSNFNAFGSGVHAALVASNLVQTSDTGQIDWTTNTVYPNNTTGVSCGYEIWRFNDTLQSSTPVYIKIEFGSSGSGSAALGFWITIGKGSDGAGNITDVTLARTAVANSGAASASTPCYASADINRIAINCLMATNAAYGFGFAIERTHGADGQDDADGVVFVGLGTIGTKTAHILWDGSSPAPQAAWNTTVPPSGSGALAPDINVYPVRCWTPGEGYPLHSVMAYVSTDFTPGATFAITSYDGVSRTYVAVGVKAVGYGGTAYSMWRYE